MLIHIKQNKCKYFQNNAIPSKYIDLLYYLRYNTKGNKMKLYICSYNVYALGFCCNIPLVNGKLFSSEMVSTICFRHWINYRISFGKVRCNYKIWIVFWYVLFSWGTEWKTLSTWKLYMPISVETYLLNLVLWF